ncbi:MAG: hypothetical protein WC061_04905 [Melioribacteraceae bacterium]
MQPYNIKYLTIILLVLTCFCSDMAAQDCKAKVQITVNKNDAMIYIDSTLAGSGTINLELKKGRYSLSINEPLLRWGSSPVLDTILISDCLKVYHFSYELRKRAPLIGTSAVQFAADRQTEEFFNSFTFKILLGSAALLGGVAAYLKIKADKRYDEYLRIKNQSMLNEVSKLDLYSGISFGLLQINIGYLIYKFLTE